MPPSNRDKHKSTDQPYIHSRTIQSCTWEENPTRNITPTTTGACQKEKKNVGWHHAYTVVMPYQFRSRIAFVAGYKANIWMERREETILSTLPLNSPTLSQQHEIGTQWQHRIIINLTWCTALNPPKSILVTHRNLPKTTLEETRCPLYEPHNNMITCGNNSLKGNI